MKKLLSMIILAVLVSANLFGHSLMNTMAKEQPGPVYNRYYKSIQISDGDSLWSIAREFNNHSNMSTKEYVSELKSMNRILSDTIHKGQYLTVVYFEEQ